MSFLSPASTPSLSLTTLSEDGSEFKWQSLFLNNHGNYFQNTANSYITREDVLLVMFKCGLEPSLKHLNELMKDLSSTPVASLCPEKEGILFRFFQSQCERQSIGRMGAQVKGGVEAKLTPPHPPLPFPSARS